MVCLSADQFAENLLESNGADVKRLKLEGRNGILTWKWVCGIPGPQVTSRPDEGMPAATARKKIPTVPPPALPPEEHVPEMRGQGVHAKPLRIRAFWSEIGRTPGCPACETPGLGSHTLVNARRIKMPGPRAAEKHQRRRRNVELLEIWIHNRWTRVEVRRVLSQRGQKQPL